MAKEEEFAMIEELKYNNRVEINLKNQNFILLENIQDFDVNLGDLRTLWNKNEFKAFIDELLVLHSKMK